MVKYVISILSAHDDEFWLGLSKDGKKLSLWPTDIRNVRGQHVISFESDYVALAYVNDHPMIQQLLPCASSWIEIKRIIIF